MISPHSLPKIETIDFGRESHTLFSKVSYKLRKVSLYEESLLRYWKLLSYRNSTMVIFLEMFSRFKDIPSILLSYNKTTQLDNLV